MHPLEPLKGTSEIERLLRCAPAAEVQDEIARQEALPGGGGREHGEIRVAALAFARGALALRERAHEAAGEDLTRAAAIFDALGERAAADLTRCEALLARLRRGQRAGYAQIAAELEILASRAEQEGTAEAERVWIVATHYRGLAEQLLGHTPAAQRALYAALRRSEQLPHEQARILASLGALYVELGACAAAEVLLEDAAELYHGRGDAVGEAMVCGELGAAALGLGEPERARVHLERQERLCAGLGDALGRARALALLADIALELGQPGEAVELATSARATAADVGRESAFAAPSGDSAVKMWAALAAHVHGRARRAMDAGGAGAEDLETASSLFAELGSPLGAALAAWDRATRDAEAGASADAWFHPAWALASLGHGARVAQLLRDHRAVSDGLPSEAGERTLAAMAQGAPRLMAQQEVALAHEQPEALAEIAARRAAAQRNLGRLAALALAPPGLLVAVIASSRAGARGLSLPPQRAAAACVAVLPELAVWIWPASTPLPEVGRDLAALRVALGEDARAALGLAPEGRVLSPPFAGESGPELDGMGLAEPLAAAPALPPGALRVDARISWSGEAEARVVMAGYETRRLA